MGASDYMVDPQSKGFGPPNMAAELFKMISSLPDAYQEGVKQKYDRGQMARTENLQKPILGPDGKPSQDAMAIASELARRYPEKSLELPVQALTTKATQDYFDNRGREGPDFPSGGGSPYSPSNPNMTPDAHTGRAGRVGQNEEGSQGPAGENPAHQNARQLAINAGIDPDSPELKQAFGKNLDRDFTSADQAKGAAAKIKNLKLAGAFGPVEDDAGAPAAPPAQLTTAGLRASAAGQPPVGGYMPGVQPPPAGAPGPQMAQAAPGLAGGMQPFLQQPPQRAPAPQGAPGLMPQAQIDAMRNRATQLLQQGQFVPAVAAVNKQRAENLMKAADEAQKTRDEIAKKRAEATDPEIQGSKGLELAQKQELTRGDHLQTGIQGAAREFETSLKPHLDAMRGILNNPNFVSGAGVGFQEALNKIRSSPLFASLPGYDPNAALPNEAIRKVVAASILNQTTELKAEAAEMGGSAGRLFQQQISLMEKAAQNPENTAPALRYLTELQTRMGEHARGIAELANNYEGKYGKGVLDNGFNEVLSKYNRDNPIFKEAEIKDMRRFAPPPAPAFHTEDDAKAWARKNNIPVGDPIKMPSGKIIPAP